MRVERRRKLWTVEKSESVLRVWLRGRTFYFRVHGPSSRPVLTFLILVFLKLKIAYDAFFLLYNIYNLILKHLEKNYDLIIRLFNIIVQNMNELAL